MTIDELLEIAVGMVKYADIEIGRDRGSLERAAQYAVVAQAAATTVQATIMAQLARTAGLDTAIRGE
jgi:hypothetical protein